MAKEKLKSRSALCIGLIFIALTCTNLQTNGQIYLDSRILHELAGLKRENRFDEALALLDNRIITLQANKDQRPVLEAKLMKADLYRLRGQSDRSASLLDTILAQCYADFSNDDPIFAELFTIQGTLLLTRGELKKGRIAINNAIGIYSASFGNEDTILAPCYNKLGNYYYFIKCYDSAMACYSNALKLADRKSNNLEDRASYIQNIGIIYLERSDYAMAEKYFLESLNIKESIYSKGSLSLGRIYLNLARFYQSVSNLDRAFVYIEKAEDIFSVNGSNSHFELGKAYWNKGLIYYFLGDYDLAITYLVNAKQIIDSSFAENKQLISSLNSDIGNVYSTLNKNDKAIYYFNLSLEGADSLLQVKTFRNIAKLYFLQGDLKRTKEYFDKIFSITNYSFHIKNPDNALTFLNFGNYLVKAGSDSALIFLNKAYEIFDQNKGFHDRDVAAALSGIGDYYFAKGKLWEALAYYQKSLIAISGSFTDTNILENPSLKSLDSDFRIAKILSTKGICLHEYFIQSGDIKYLISAINTYLLSLDLDDKIRISFRAENSQLMLSGDIYLTYKQAIENCQLAFELSGNSDWLHKAFELSERSKSMVLLNELKDANAKKIGLIPEDLKSKEREIKSNLNVYNNSIIEEENQIEPDNNKLIYLRQKQLVYEKKYDSLVDYLGRIYPEYYKLKYDPSVISVKGLQRIVEKNEVIIEYSLSNEYLYTFIISQNIFDVKKIPVDSTIISDIFALRDNLDFDNVAQYSFEDYMNFQRISYKLYKILIDPVAAYLENKKVIIIPDEELNYLSFEALIEEITPVDSIEFRSLPYLIKKYPISYASSSSIFHLVKQGRMQALNTGVLALAPSNSIFTRSFLASNKALAQQLKTSMDLPGATWEAEAILKMMKGKKLIGEEATESEFKKLASSFDILHFATHTRIDDQNPLSSILSFYPFGGAGEDGVLHTYEIYNLDLKGELAVLSACSTGDGKLQKGEGVISLARAFTYAGMPSVIMTLWDVEDISSGNIIPSFYYLLGKGYAKDVALRQAKLNYIENTRPEIETHPAFWSGYVLYGNNRGFRQKQDEIFIILLFVSGGLIIFISFVLIRRYIHFRKNLRSFKIDLPIEFRAEDRF